jgi:hypothetical protein
MESLLHAVTQFPGSVLSPGCPFKIEIYPNISHNNKNLNIFLVSLKFRTPRSGRGSPVHLGVPQNGVAGGVPPPNTPRPQLPSFMDISIFKPSKELNQFDFDLARVETPLRTLDHLPGFPIPIANPIYLYIQQLSSSKTNTRPNKIASRKERADLLSVIIYRMFVNNDQNILSSIRIFLKWFRSYTNLRYIHNDDRYVQYEDAFFELLDTLGIEYGAKGNQVSVGGGKRKRRITRKKTRKNRNAK